MSRLRRTAPVLTLGLVAMLAACTAEAGPPVLTWHINPDDGGQERIAQTCTEEAGGEYVIQTALLPREASDQREQLARRLAAQDSSIDIMSLDPPFIPEMAEPGFLSPVPEELQDTDGVVQGASDSAMWGEELVTVPFWANTQLLWYRESVAEEAGLDMNEPVTWDALIEAAEEHDLHLGVHGALAESLTVWVNALVASAGGEILVNPEAPSDELQLDLDSEQGRQAAEVVSRIGSQGLGGPGMPTADENAAMNLFQGERGSFMVNWPFVYTAMAAADSEVMDDLAWTTYPRMDAEIPAAPPVGGINLGVGAFSPYQDQAWEAVECIVRPEHQAEYFLTDGNPPSAMEAYEDAELQEEFPMADLIRDSLEEAEPRPQTPFYNEISIGLQNTWHPVSGVDPQVTPGSSQQFITEVLRGERLL